MPFRAEFYSPTEEDTLLLSRRIGQKAWNGLVVCLSGGLGAGKTVFARGFARGMGIEEPITSPTFPLIQEYRGRKNLWHMDLYRLRGEDEVREIGAEEFFGGDGVCLVEWPDRAGSLLGSDCMWVHLEIRPEGGRLIRAATESEQIWNRFGFAD